MRRKNKNNKREKIGPVAQKIILLLSTGISLSLTRRPDYYFRIVKSFHKEWQKINQRSLREAIRKLYQSQLIDYQEDNDGTINLVLSVGGKEKCLKYNLDTLRIKNPQRWDGLWRIAVFDIPESKKKERDAFSLKLKNLGMYSLQKSVFIYPYDCQNEIDFISEVLGIKSYVRFILAKDVDVAIDLKQRFKIR